MKTAKLEKVETFPPAHAGKFRTHWRLGLRLVFGIFWAADAVLKWIALANGFNYEHLVEAQVAGQPAFVAAWINAWIKIMGNIPNFSLLMAVTESMIAVFILLGLFTTLTSMTGIVFSFLIWSTAEAFGGVFMVGATDIGPSPLYIALFVGLIVSMAGRQNGLDAILSRMYPRLAFLM